jgi:hypothetical protein
VPYEGTLTIWRGIRADQLRDYCREVSKVACSSRPKQPPYTRCDLFISESALTAKGFSLAFILRHELAHCNGWGQDHAGGRKVLSSTKVQMPKLPESMRWLPVYPPLACITPDRTVEPCDNRRADPALSVARPGPHILTQEEKERLMKWGRSTLDYRPNYETPGPSLSDEKVNHAN